MKRMLLFILLFILSVFVFPHTTSPIYAQASTCNCHLTCDLGHPCLSSLNYAGCSGLLSKCCYANYCSSTCLNGCSSLSCSGGTCNPYCRTTINCGSRCSCIASTTGGSCSTPTCPLTCLNGCSTNTCSTYTCNAYCSRYNQDNCLCGCTPSATGGTCKTVYNVGSCLCGGNICTGVCNSKWCNTSFCTCGCSQDSCDGITYCIPKYCSSTCPLGCSSTSCTGGTCNPYCNKICSSTQHCVASSSGGTCVANTGTPTPTTNPYTCLTNGNQCIPLIVGTCQELGYPPATGSCPANTMCCSKTFVSNTPTKAATPTPTPITCGALGRYCCSGYTCPVSGTCNSLLNLCVDNQCSGLVTCSNSKLYSCVPGTCLDGICLFNPSLSSTYVRTCLLGCNATNTGCNEASYCVDKKCNPTAAECPGGVVKNTLDWCWSSYTAAVTSGFTNPSYTTCVNTTGCNGLNCTTAPTPSSCPVNTCTAIIDVCTADTIVPPCYQRYPGDINNSVEHHDNCYDPVTGRGIGCGPPCTAPTSTGAPCVPDCSGAGSYCSGIRYDDPTGCGRCVGTKTCTGTLTAQSFAITTADTACANAVTWANSLSGTTFGFSPAVVPASKIQGASAVSWTGVTTDGTTVYTLTSVPAGTYATGNVCLSRNGGAWSQASAGSLSDGGTLSFRVGYIPQNGWVQTAVGDVYAATQCTSSVPTTATNPYFSLVGGGGTAGLVTYGTDYDFSLSTSDLGGTLTPPRVSPNGWLTQAVYTNVYFYERLKEKLMNQTGVISLNPITDLQMPSCATESCIYYVDGDTTTKAVSPWAIPANKKIILVVNGNITINSPITIASGGFFAVIANGNIVVSPNVGGLTTDTNPHLQGIYIATNASGNAIFASGESTTVGSERLNVKGTVVADSFSLQRDLGIVNDTTPGESFTFDPQLLFTMPDSMMDAPYIWQEVAP